MTVSTAIRRLDATDPDFARHLDHLLSWESVSDDSVNQRVLDIIKAVRERGDAALVEFTEKFDGLQVASMADLILPRQRLELALTRISAEQRIALEKAAERVRIYHERQKQDSWTYTEADGTVLGQKVTPLDRAGLYVPGGKASYPSSVLMNAIPAKVAGVPEVVMVVPTPRGEINEIVLAAAAIAGVDRVFTIGGAQAVAALAYGTESVPRVDKIVGPGNIYVATAKRHVFGQVGIDMIAGPSEILLATPPQPDGTVKPEVLIAARVAGVHRVFKMGGAHAIAALAYGTESVPRVDKIVGPGNVYVATAKRLVFGEVGIDSEAGPSEVAIVADRTATPAWVAADLLSQAEHDEQACAVLFTPSKALVPRIQEAVAKQLKAMKRGKIAEAALARGGAIVVTKDVDEAVTLCNRYAPEHLMLALDSPDAAMKRVTNAGAIFVGHYSPVAVGDYLAGPNHVLPTGGTARFFSPLGVEDFLKRSNFVRFEPPKLRELGADVIRLATLEGFTAHGESVELRLQKIRRARREREAAREAALED